MNMHWRKRNSVGFSPDYRDFGRGILFQSLIDLLAIFAWAGLGALLLMTVGSPLIFILLFVYGG